MKENKQKLENFKESIKDYRKLSPIEACELYKEILEESNESVRQDKRQELICGLLNAVYDHILESYLSRFISPIYDMDDIISSFVEVLINRIDEGYLLKKKPFWALFNVYFYKKVTESLLSKNIMMPQNIGININLFTAVFMEYCALKNTGIDYSFNEMIKELETNLGISFYSDFSKLGLHNFYALLEGIYQTLSASDYNVPDFNYDKINKVVRLLIFNGLSTMNIDIDNVMCEGMADSIDQRVFCEEALGIIEDKELLDTPDFRMIKQYYIDDECITDVVTEMGVSVKKAKKLESTGLKKLKNIPELQDYVGSTPIKK